MEKSRIRDKHPGSATLDSRIRLRHSSCSEHQISSISSRMHSLHTSIWISAKAHWDAFLEVSVIMNLQGFLFFHHCFHFHDPYNKTADICLVHVVQHYRYVTEPNML
jgi:hypothetical protein